MAPDISNNTVAILLIVVIAVSAIGTYAVMNQGPQQIAEAPQQGEVSLAIAAPPPEASVSLAIADAETNTEEQIQ